MKFSNDSQGPAKHSFEPISKTITLHIQTGHIPSFKNSKRSILDKNSGQQRTLTSGKIKRRMNNLEDAIACALFSLSQIVGSGTPSECSKQLRTVLCGLCDDSIREIPCGEWDVQYVEPGQEGIILKIEPITKIDQNSTTREQA